MEIKVLYNPHLYMVELNYGKKNVENRKIKKSYFLSLGVKI